MMLICVQQEGVYVGGGTLTYCYRRKVNAKCDLEGNNGDWACKLEELPKVEQYHYG